MIKVSLLFVSILAALGVLLAPGNAHAQSTAQDVCLARWAWNTDDVPDGEPYWEAPHQNVGTNLGILDLRSVSDKGPGPTASGWALFSYDQPMGSTGMHCLGGDLGASMTAPQVNTLAVLLGLESGDIRARNMRQVITELFLEEGDPTGVSRWKPFQTSRKGLNIYLGGYGQIYGERFSETSQATQNTLDVRWADYRRQRAAGVPVSQLQRQTGWDSWRIFGREPTSADLARLLPTEYRNDGAACSNPRLCTTITEDFNTADSDTLGPDLSWTELGTTDVDVVSNQANAESSQGYARAESDLAGADMIAEANVTNTVQGTVRGPGLCVRYATAADTAYWGQAVDGSGGTGFDSYAIVERTAGTNSFGAAATGFDDANGGIVQVEVIGSTINVYYNGALRQTATDASITGNTRAGICGRHTGADRMQWDNFEAADIVAAGRRIIRID